MAGHLGNSIRRAGIGGHDPESCCRLEYRVNADATSDDVDWPLVVAGDQRAFAHIFDLHADLLYRFVLRRTGDTTLAEDITSAVFLEAWRQRESITLLHGSLRAWLLGVARNMINRHWRTIERSTRALDRLESESWGHNEFDHFAEDFDTRERFADVLTALGGLPSNQRDVLLMVAWEQLSYDEIAAVLDIPVGTVRSRIARAREHLRRVEGTARSSRASDCGSTNHADQPDREPTAERNPDE